MFKRFVTYCGVGVVNTCLHWLAFTVFHASIGFDLDQAPSNLGAFIIAATFSFFVNARLTFQAHASPARYFSFIGFMGLCSWLVGHVGDRLHLPAVVTLIAFSAVSLLVGFLYSSYVVFGVRKA